MTCQFLVKNLHFINYSARTRQSLDRQQQNKEAHVVMPTRKLLKYNTFFFVQILSLVQRTETEKNFWLEVIGDKIEFL